MKTQYILPLIIICASFGGSAVYAFLGDWRRAVYWLCVAVITIVVTF